MIVRDGIDVEEYRPYMQKITDALIFLGYLLCELNIMVLILLWLNLYLNFKDDISRWVGTQDMKNFLDLAIFATLFAVAGDKTCLLI